MDKLTAIKIKYQDGTYSDQVPISALAQNIDWDENHSLVDILGKVDLSKGNIQRQINSKPDLGETSSTAYRGDRGKTAYDHATDSNRLTTAKSTGLYKVAATSEGHIANLTSVTKSDITNLGIPASDTNVTQTSSSTNASYEVLFSGTADDTTRTEGARKSSGLTFNPSTKNLTVTKINGVDVGNSPKFTDEDHITTATTSGSGNAVTSVSANNQGALTITKGITFVTNQDGVSGSSINRFGVCDTSANVAAKTASITSGTFSLVAGATVAVKFTYTNTANSPTLNVNSTGAKSIYVNGAQITSGGNKSLLSGTVEFVYDGSHYNLIGAGNVTGVKGDKESSYRTGNINITPDNIGATMAEELTEAEYNALSESEKLADKIFLITDSTEGQLAKEVSYDNIDSGLTATNVQDAIDDLALKVVKDYVTPEMYGAKGDGVTDDTEALQNSFDSEHTVYLSKKYGVSNTLNISKDTSVICSSESEILPLSNIGTLIEVGTGTVITHNPVLNGLIKVTWYGGKINCKNGDYIASVGLELGKLYHSKFADISVINVSNTGVKYSGTFGAIAICENVAVKGTANTLAECGFDLGRNDQRLYNCSAIDCKVGFYIRQAYNRLTGCAVWVTHSNNWTLTTAYVIDANDCGLIECTCDTVYTGVLFSAKAKTCTITNLFWICNTGVVKDYTNMRLFSGNDSNNYVSVHCIVNGLQSQEYTKPVYLKMYIANDGNFSIFGLATPNKYYMVDNNIVINPQQISDKSKIIGDFYQAKMATSPTPANGALTASLVVPAGRYIVIFNPPYITGLETSGSACRLKLNNSGGNYHYLKNGWNEGFSEIVILSEETTIYVEGATAITHQNNSGSGLRAIRIS